MSVTFRRSGADTGELGNSSSIQPTLDGELINQSNLNRPSDNLRVRTEELARAVESLEYILQSSNNSSTLLRYIKDGTEVKSGLIKFFYKTQGDSRYYYIEPTLPSIELTGTKPSIVIVGSSTNGFNYILNLSAIRGYFQQGLAENQIEGYNKYLGLSSPGDCLALRIPTVSSSYSSEVMLPRSTSNFTAAGEATLGSTMLDSLNNISLTSEQARTSILKIPSKNSISITATGTVEDNSLLTLLELAVASSGSTALSDSGRSLELDILQEDGTRLGHVFLDLGAISKEGSTYSLPRTGYRSLEHLQTLPAGGSYVFSIDASPSYFTYNSTVTVLDTTMLPKNEYLLPLAFYTGDAILVPGLSSVNVIDIETRISSGGAILDQFGVMIGETGTAVSVFETRTNISYSLLSAAENIGFLISGTGETQQEYFRLPININIPEAGIGQDIYLDSLEIHMVMDESQPNQAANINDQTIRGTKISLGIYDLGADAANFITGTTKFSFDKCVNSSTRDNAALSKTILRDFPLTSFKDDYSCHVELQDSVRNTPATNKTILVWLYADQPGTQFFAASDSGKFNLDFRFKYVTRVSEAGVGLMSTEDMAILHP